jgi:hypothetical protein
MTEELDHLLQLRGQIQALLTVLQDQDNFSAMLDASLNPAIHSFLLYSAAVRKEVVPGMQAQLAQVTQQVKALCKHEYEEDDIDICGGDSSIRITYCSVCFSTFS